MPPHRWSHKLGPRLGLAMGNGVHTPCFLYQLPGILHQPVTLAQAPRHFAAFCICIMAHDTPRPMHTRVCRLVPQFPSGALWLSVTTPAHVSGLGLWPRGRGHSLCHNMTSCLYVMNSHVLYGRSNGRCMAMVQLHCISLQCCCSFVGVLPAGHLDVAFISDRRVPMVFYATDEPIFFLRCVLITPCVHVQ